MTMKEENRNGRYRKADPQDHGDTDQASGEGAGAGTANPGETGESNGANLMGAPGLGRGAFLTPGQIVPLTAMEVQQRQMRQYQALQYQLSQQKLSQLQQQQQSAQFQNAAFGSAFHVVMTGETTATKDDLEDGGVVVGELEAWRAWRVDDGWLYSTSFNDFEWAPGEIVEAECDLSKGIHAFKTRKAAIEYHWHRSFDVVIGRVALWGEVIEFSNGWHAQFAKPISFDVYRRECDWDNSETWLGKQNFRAAELEALRKTYLDLDIMPIPLMREIEAQP